MEPGFTELDVTLRDGRVAHLRTMSAQDEAELLQAFDRMSDDARYMRFMRVVREPNLERLRKVLGSFPENGIGLVATVPAADGLDIVGSAIAVIESEAGTCEFAINVDSKFGGSGLATELMKQLIDTARKRGLQMMEGFVLTENQSMLRLARRLGFSIVTDPDDRAVRICRLQLGGS
jgi:RimJ/RimL family protein N-acetyltransferase